MWNSPRCRQSNGCQHTGIHTVEQQSFGMAMLLHTNFVAEAGNRASPVPTLRCSTAKLLLLLLLSSATATAEQ
jgi:hypothetical protein